MSKEEMLKHLQENCFADTCSIEEIKKAIQQDYEDLIWLRNRIKEGTDEDNYDYDTTLYEEDSITLDHCLDYMELFMTHLGLGRMGGLKYDN